MIRRLLPLLLAGLVTGPVAAAGERAAMTAFDRGQAIDPASVSVAGRMVEAWVVPADRQLVFRATPPLTVPPSGELFAEISYFDDGYGRLDVSGTAADGGKASADPSTRTALTDSKQWVSSLLRLTGLAPGAPAEIRVRRTGGTASGLVIGRGTLQTEPFAEPFFAYLLEKSWRHPYAGPTTDGGSRGTLRGKVMVGYQGWYRTPNDPDQQGWVHWGDIPNGVFSVDMWPDVSAYPAEALVKAADIRTRSGKTAYLFSSAHPAVTRQHFRWMREHRIDGAFLQRFLTDGTYPLTGRPEWVLGNVREAANREGRVWAVEYDVSGYPDEALLEGIKADWKWLVEEFGLRQDPAYARERGKPVVCVWGMAVGGRGIRPETAEAVFDFLRNDPRYGGNYVIGGLPGNWRRLGPEWQRHLRQHDGALAWMSESWKEDVAEFQALGIDYFPHVKPGFSWANLKHIPSGATDAYTPRQGGEFYAAQLRRVAASGADRLFVGMFDEYDEATAIMPMSDDPPPTPRRPGVHARIFASDRWEGRAVTLHLPRIDLELPAGSPGNGLPDTGYSAILSGTLVAPEDGRYLFQLEGPPGGTALLRILDRQVEVKAIPPAPAASLEVELRGGELSPYQITYTHGGTPGRVRLFWRAPGNDRTLVPASALVDAWGRFLTNEGKPADHWLRLTGSFKNLLPPAPAPR